MQKIDVGYAFYCNKFCCGGERLLPPSEFEKYIERARKTLVGLGVEYSLNFEEDIMLCLCEIAEALYAQKRNLNIKSESIDGYSVTFNEAAYQRKTLIEIASERLGRLGLLYAGVERCD